MEVPRTLPALARWARGEPALHPLLTRPWRQTLAGLNLSRAAREALEVLCAKLRAPTLGQALEDPLATGTLFAISGTSQANRITADLVELMGEIAEEGYEDEEEGYEEEDDPFATPAPLQLLPVGLAAAHGSPRAAQIEPVPTELPRIREWARKHGVEDRLGDSSARIEDLVGHPAVDMSGSRTIEDLLAPAPATQPVARTWGKRQRHLQWEAEAREQNQRSLRRAAAEHLQRAAVVRASVLARRRAAAAAGAPVEPPLARLWNSLEQARASLAAEVLERPLGTYQPQIPRVAAEPLRIVCVESTDLQWGVRGFTTEIFVEEDPPRIRCECAAGAQGRCAHALSALDEALDLLRLPSPQRDQLASILGTPIWSRFLASFGQELTRRVAPRSDDLRLAWRITGDDLRGGIEPVLQKRLKGGGFSAGQRLRLDELRTARGAFTDPRDERAVRALTVDFDDTRSTLNAIPRSRVARTLEALAGHPLVFLDTRTGAPARISRERLTVALEPRGETVAIAFRLGPRSWDAATLADAVDGEGTLVVVDRAGGRVSVSTLDARARALLAAFSKHPASFPAEIHDELLRALGGIQESVDLVLPEALAGEPIEGDARPVVRLAPRDGGDVDVDIMVRPAPGGPVFPPGEGAPTVLHAVQGRRVAARRDLPREAAAAAALAEGLPAPAEDGARPWSYLLDEQTTLDLLAKVRDLGDAAVLEWREPDRRLVLAGVARAGELRVRVTDRRDWFSVEGEVEIDGQAVPLAALLEAVRGGRRYVRVGPGKFAAIENDLRRRVQQAGDVLHAGRKGLEVALPGVALLEDLVEDPKMLEAAARFRDLVRRLEESRHLDPALPAGLTAELRHYQLDGYKWLMRLAAWGAGACLADDMGLGKTVQALAVLLARKDLGPALVIAPTSVGQNWIDEAARFAPGLRARLYRGPGREKLLAEARAGDLLVTSYAVAVRDAAPLAAVRFASLVLDEAQAVKNALTRRARAIAGLDADLRVALTGTPVENHLGDLWSLMRTLTPGLLGSWEHFRDRFATPIERGRDPERRAALARVMRPFLLRRTKAEVAPELPPRTEIQRVVHPSAAERALYDAARTAALEALATAGGDARFTLLAALTRLRRLACHPRLLDDASTVPSSKLAALLEIVEELREEGHRALVFSQFTSHLALVREALDAARITYDYLDGSTPAEDRARRVAAFQSGRADVFLISLKAGGSGLNLTGADYVIHLDPWWNPAVEDQATDRAHRIGQTRAVTVIRLVMRGTIEEAVLALHGDKRALAASVLDEDGSPARLSTDELAALLRAGIDEAGADEESDAAGAEEVSDAETAPEPPSPRSERPPPAPSQIRRGASARR